jgi:hypothetical protein
MLPGNTTTSYYNLHKGYVAETGFVGAFYRGLWPWGIIQCVKGIPVLFVQSESEYQLKLNGFTERTAAPLSGIFGGMAQAMFVCPTQKLKVTVVSDPVLNQMAPVSAIKTVVKAQGVVSLLDGLGPMMLRRGLDWMIRFTMSHRIKELFVQRRVDKGYDRNLPLHELMACGMLGGSFSAVTHPIDNIITNSQKPLPPGASKSAASVIVRMWKESGSLAFTRGFMIKIVDNSYHTMWMYGIGSFISQIVHKQLEGVA